ncbi:DUF2235 domain-containing protein [Bradyrhizobium elkanii]|uniref:DUF2235 domain-containing protein n=1 Tax=Bradyrhizobium elkanii TaxID=29448 RepID=UPI002167DB6F|nr:DUF2235 domain-containing protein [Bradyrhizobium elkanii]
MKPGPRPSRRLRLFACIGSRGAYTARALAGLIAIDGILKAGSPIGVTELFDRYRRADEQTIWTLASPAKGTLHCLVNC